MFWSTTQFYFLLSQIFAVNIVAIFVFFPSCSISSCNEMFAFPGVKTCRLCFAQNNALYSVWNLCWNCCKHERISDSMKKILEIDVRKKNWYFLKVLQLIVLQVYQEQCQTEQFICSSCLRILQEVHSLGWLAKKNDEKFRAHQRTSTPLEGNMAANSNERHFHSCYINHNVNVPQPVPQMPTNTHQQQFRPCHYQQPVYQSLPIIQPGFQQMPQFYPVPQVIYYQAYSPPRREQDNQLTAQQMEEPTELKPTTINTTKSWYADDDNDNNTDYYDEEEDETRHFLTTSSEDETKQNVDSREFYQMFQSLVSLKDTSSKVETIENEPSISQSCEFIEGSQCEENDEAFFAIFFKKSLGN